MHSVLPNLALLHKAGIRTNNLSIEFHTHKEDEEWLNNTLREKGIKQGDMFVHIHPTSRWLFKCWQDEAMASLIDRIQEQYRVKVVMTCSPDKREVDKAGRLIGPARTGPVAFSGQHSLKK